MGSTQLRADRFLGRKPRALRKLRKLRRLEREMSRRQKGSANRAKTRRKVAAAHNEVARARRDYHHKVALALVRENQVLHVEDLNIAGMVRNRRLARAISDAGWAQFVKIIGEKADHCGRTVHTVSRPRPQRRQDHSRCRAGRETKRLWSPCKTATRCGSGR